MSDGSNGNGLKKTRYFFGIFRFPRRVRWTKPRVLAEPLPSIDIRVRNPVP